MFMDWKNYITKRSILLKTIHTFNPIPSKIPMVVFTKKNRIILKCLWNQKPCIVKAILRKKEAAMHPDVKLHRKTIVIKTVWHQTKTRRIDQCNNAEHRN